MLAPTFNVIYDVKLSIKSVKLPLMHMIRLSLASFGIFHRILYYMSHMKSVGEKKHPFLTNVMNLWVAGIRD